MEYFVTKSFKEVTILIGVINWWQELI